MLYIKQKNTASELMPRPDDVCIRKWAQPINNTPSEIYSYLFQTGSSVPIGDKTMKAWTQGIYITSGGRDSIIIAIDSDLTLYLAFNNGEKWRARVL